MKDLVKLVKNKYMFYFTLIFYFKVIKFPSLFKTVFNLKKHENVEVLRRIKTHLKAYDFFQWIRNRIKMSIKNRNKKPSVPFGFLYFRLGFGYENNTNRFLAYKNKN